MFFVGILFQVQFVKRHFAICYGAVMEVAVWDVSINSKVKKINQNMLQLNLSVYLFVS